MMNTYTVFCQSANGVGTTWIDLVQARDVEHAKIVGRKQCAKDWGWSPTRVRVQGVAEGDVRIVFWEDSDE